MATPIKFGTDGWRAIIAKDYTVDNVARVATATALWLNKNFDNPTIVLGYDCRFGGPMFSETVIQIMAEAGIKVYFDRQFATTPMVSLACAKLNASAGVVITASHNPPSYNGFKIKSHYGGPAVPATIAEVEAQIPDSATIPSNSLESIEKDGLLKFINLEDMYFEHLVERIDLNLIRESGLKVAYDAMYGAGQRIFKRLIPDATCLHYEHNPGFYGQAPEPIHKNLTEFSELLANGDFNFGFATDGDADRIGLYNIDGQFVDSHHVLLLLIHILHKSQGLTGKVVVTFSVSDKVRKLCDAYGLPIEVTKIGFKYICEIMVKEDVLVGGEESGGIAVKGHVPERDGIWDAMVILEHMAKTGKSIQDLINQVYAIVGGFSYDRDDLHITNELKSTIIKNCEADAYQKFGDLEVVKKESIDGHKYFFADGRTVLIRPSGTEPVLRVYGEASDMAGVRDLLDKVNSTLLAAETV